MPSQEYLTRQSQLQGAQYAGEAAADQTNTATLKQSIADNYKRTNAASSLNLEKRGLAQSGAAIDASAYNANQEATKESAADTNLTQKLSAIAQRIGAGVQTTQGKAIGGINTAIADRLKQQQVEKDKQAQLALGYARLNKSGKGGAGGTGVTKATAQQSLQQEIQDAIDAKANLDPTDTQEGGQKFFQDLYKKYSQYGFTDAQIKKIATSLYGS